MKALAIFVLLPIIPLNTGKAETKQLAWNYHDEVAGTQTEVWMSYDKSNWTKVSNVPYKITMHRVNVEKLKYFKIRYAQPTDKKNFIYSDWSTIVSTRPDKRNSDIIKHD